MCGGIVKRVMFIKDLGFPWILMEIGKLRFWYLEYGGKKWFAPLPQCAIQLMLNFTFTCLSAGLKPNTLYHYQCGDPSIPAMSSTYYFKTMPASGPKSYPSKIAIVGDLGLTYNTTSTVDHMIGNNPDLILLVGDVCYANLYLTNGSGADCYSCSFSRTPIHETYQPRWDYWGR